MKNEEGIEDKVAGWFFLGIAFLFAICFIAMIFTAIGIILAAFMLFLLTILLFGLGIAIIILIGAIIEFIWNCMKQIKKRLLG